MADYQLPEGFEEVQTSDIPEGYEEVAPAEPVPSMTEGVSEGMNWTAAPILRDIPAGIYEGMRRGAEFAAPVTSKIAQTIYPGMPDLQELPGMLPEATPQESPLLFEAAATAGPTMIGGTGAGAVAGKVMKEATTLIPRIIKSLATTTGASVGYGTSVNPKQENLLYGKGGWFEGLDETDAEGKEDRLNIFYNDVVDAMALAYPTDGAAALIGKAASFLNNTVAKPAYRWVTGNIVKDAEETVATEFIKHAGLVRNAKTPQERQLALEEMAKKMLEHEKIVFKFGDEDEAILRDTVSALEESLKGSDVADAETIMQKARSLRQGALQTGAKGGDLATKLSEPSVQTERILAEEEARRGGQKSIDVAGEGVQQQATKKFQETGLGPEMAKSAEIDVAEEELGRALADDPALKSQLQQLNENVTVNIFEGRNQTTKKIVSNVNKAYDEMEGELAKLADEIPEGQIVEFNIGDELAEGDEVGKTLSDITDPSFLKPYEKKGLLNFTLDEQGAVESVTGDFKKLYKTVVPELNRKIKSGKAGGTNVEDLMTFRQMIRDKVDEVEGAEGLRDYYRDVWSPIWKDGKLDKWRNTRFKENAAPVQAGVEQKKIVESALTEDPDFTSHLNKIKGNPELTTDWYLQDAASTIQRQINEKKQLSDVDLTSITSKLEEYGANLQQTNPASYKRVNDFLTKVRNSRGNIDKLQGELKEVTKLREKVEKDVFQQEYKDFFDKSGLAKKGNQYANFDNLLKKGDSGNTIQEILDTAKSQGREDIVKGIQSAYLRHMKNEAFSDSAKVVSSGGKAFKLSFINDALSGKNNTLAYGRQIFADEPIAVDFLESMLKEGKRIQESVGNVGQIAPVDYTRFKGETSAALDRIVTWTFGVLNKTAARVRSLKGAAMQNYTEPSEVLASVVDRFYTDPEYAASLIKRVAEAETKGRTSPEFRQAFRDWMLFQVKDSGADIHDVAQLESDIKGTLDSVESQTEEVLNKKK